jgi:hypothetical protein
MMVTFDDARAFVARFVDGGRCETDQEVGDAVNVAVRRLLAKANWKDTVWRMAFDCSTDCITLPWCCEAIVAVATDCYPARVWGPGYEFCAFGPGVWNGATWGKCNAKDMGDGFVTQHEIPEGGANLVLMCEDANDSGVTVNFRGHIEGEMEIYAGGLPGFSLQALPFAAGGVGCFPALQAVVGSQSEKVVTDLTFAKKPMTNGYLWLYGMADGRPRYLIARYHPRETKPYYRRYQLTSTDRVNGKNIVALVKIRYVPAVFDDDTVLIQNLDAIGLMVQALEREKVSDPDGSAKFQQLAVVALEEQKQSADTGEKVVTVSSQFALGEVVNIV